jgi:DNA-binding NarL/FixJ family response regulator
MGITVAVVDQEAIFTDALAARLQAEEDVEVVAGLLARAPLPCVIVGRQADVMLLDADLPGDAAARLCEELSERDDAPRVILLSHT